MGLIRQLELLLCIHDIDGAASKIPPCSPVRELIALGPSNIFGGSFKGFAASTSLSRSGSRRVQEAKLRS